MASTPAPPVQKKIGAIYSWLIRQPTDFVAGVKTVSDAEHLYDAHISGGTKPHD